VETLLLFMGSFIKVAPLSPIVASMQTIRHCEANPEIYRSDTNPASLPLTPGFPSAFLATPLSKRAGREREVPGRQRAPSSRSLLSTFRLEAHPETSYGDKCL